MSGEPREQDALDLLAYQGMALSAGVAQIAGDVHEYIDTLVQIFRETIKITNATEVCKKHVTRPEAHQPVNGCMQCRRVELDRGGRRKNEFAVGSVEFPV